MAQTPLLILDIDSSSVGACLVLGGDTPTLSYVQRVPVGTGAVRDASALLPQLKSALSTLLPTYAKYAPGLTDAAVVLASPWFAASVKTLSSKAEKPVRVSERSIRSMVADFRAKNPASAAHTILEALPITVEVNGYRTRVLDPVHGTTLAVTFYESVTDQSLVDLVRDTVHTTFARAHVTWHTTPLTHAETLLSLTDEEHATIVDVGGEMTDIMILSHQRIASVGSLPVGARTIARTLGGNKDGGLADALSRLAMFARAELTEKEMAALSTALTAASKEWQQQFRAVLDAAGNTVPLSNRVFLVGERDELPWFAQVVSGAESRGQRPIVSVINHDFFTGRVTYGDQGVFDSSLVLAALFFHMRSKPHAGKITSDPVLYSVQ